MPQNPFQFSFDLGYMIKIAERRPPMPDKHMPLQDRLALRGKYKEYRQEAMRNDSPQMSYADFVAQQSGSAPAAPTPAAAAAPAPAPAAATPAPTASAPAPTPPSSAPTPALTQPAASPSADDSLILPNQTSSQPRLVPNITRPARVPSFSSNTGAGSSAAPDTPTPSPTQPSPSQPRLVPNITRPARVPSFSSNTGAGSSAAPDTPTPAPASTPASASNPPARPYGPDNPAFPGLYAMSTGIRSVLHDPVERLFSSPPAEATAAATGGYRAPTAIPDSSVSSGTGAVAAQQRPSAGATAQSRSQNAGSPGGSLPGPGAWAGNLGAAAASGASPTAALGAAAGQAGRLRANGTVAPTFGQTTPRPAPRPSPGRRYGVSPSDAKANYSAARRAAAGSGTPASPGRMPQMPQHTSM